MSAGRDDGTEPGGAQRRERMSVRPAAPAAPTEAARDVANEDFLFHLYRGSELLQDNRVHEAKTELEFALGLQPRDPKGQDLLAIVYFRIGLYPRAIQIYEELLRELPEEPTLKLNLALCYLKTGQAQAARAELEDVVLRHADHRRAWGYLGLAYQRLGEFAQAQHAFERGGHAAMSKRMSDRSLTAPPPGAMRESMVPDSRERGGEELRAAAAVAFEELDSGILSFALAEPEVPKTDSGTWHAVEPGASQSPAGRSAAAALRGRPVRHDTLEWGVPPVDRKLPDEPRPAPVPGAGSAAGAPPRVKELAKDARLKFPEGRGVAMLDNGLVLVRTQAGGRESDFAARLEALRSYAGAIATGILQRQVRGQVTQETFGGVGSPLSIVSGDAELVLGGRPSHTIVSFLLDDDLAFVREELLLGFEMRLSYENGRLAVGEGELAAMVQLRGTGAVLLELTDPMVSLDVTAPRPVSVRRDALVGWIGRLVPRELPLGEAPMGQRGLVSFSGEGAILLAAR